MMPIGIQLDKHLMHLFVKFRDRGPRRRRVVTFERRRRRRFVEDVEDEAPTGCWRLVVVVAADGG